MRHKKDPEGRVLRDREGYIREQDGKIRYRYRYRDNLTKKTICIYAKTLHELREKVKAHEKEKENGVVRAYEGRKMTLNEARDRYLQTKVFAESTQVNYIATWDNHVAKTLGVYTVATIRQSEIASFYKSLGDEGYSQSLIREIHAVLRPTFDMLVRDNVITHNPAEILLKGYGYRVKEKEALTIAEQEEFLNYIKDSNVYRGYYYMFKIALETGLRVGELIGLQWSNVNMEHGILTVDHQLVYKNYGDGCKLHIRPPKSESGRRKIPMFTRTYESFMELRKQRLKTGIHCEATIDGYNDFIFLTTRGTPIMPNAYNSVLYRIVASQNKRRLKSNPDKCVFLPHISSHTLRHTACTRMSEIGMNAKVLQYIMGHASIEVTMEIYNHIAEMERVVAEVQRVQMLEMAAENVDKNWLIEAAKAK